MFCSLWRNISSTHFLKRLSVFYSESIICSHIVIRNTSQLSHSIYKCQSSEKNNLNSHYSGILVGVCQISSCSTDFAAKKNKKASKKLHDLLKTMPKPVDLTELQGTRKALKVKAKRHPAATIDLRVVGSGANGAPTGLYVFTEQKKYLFNCGEGSQRMAFEHKIKLSMMEHILVTHKSWKNIGGLPGILLTLQDTGVPEIKLHGPPGIESLYYDTRNFIRFRDLSLYYQHYKHEGGYIGTKDDPIQIKCVPIWAQNQDEVDSTTMNKENEVKDDKTFYQLDHYQDEELRRIRLEESKQSVNLSLAYICKCEPKKGSLLLEKCVRYGVKPGPILGKLKNGEDVTLEDGRIVRAVDVTTPSDPGPIFIVVEAPSESYLDALLASPDFTPHTAKATDESEIAEVVVHFTPPNVMSDSRYKEWMSRFSPSTYHIILNENSSCLGSEAVHRIQYKLNHLSQTLFPLLEDSSIQNGENSIENQSKELNGQDSIDLQSFGVPIVQGSTLLKYSLRPKKGLDRSGIPRLTPKEYIDECYRQADFQAKVDTVRLKISSALGDSNLIKKANKEKYPNIIFLGTGSCIPNKTRNTSGILVRLSQEKTLILDCGEGTYGQLLRCFGSTESNCILKQLAGIYVSHLHADHHIGLISLLQARRKAFINDNIHQISSIPLLAPGRIINYLRSFHTNFQPILEEFELVDNSRFIHTDQMTSEEYKEICGALGMKAIEICYVIHCPNSFGVALTHTSGWKMAYSGDTMPCQKLVEIGRNCDLLIHEATMEDDLEEDAKLKTHSTISQAIQVGSEMGAKQVMLTHFSQRYSKVPILPDNTPSNVAVAFDNMRFCIDDLTELNLLYPAYVSMFAEHYDAMMEKTAKKKRKQERETAELEEILQNKNRKLEENTNEIQKNKQLKANS